MISMQLTEHCTGVNISGEPEELLEIPEAAYELIPGFPGESDRYQGLSDSVLSVFYELRHAGMGDRTVSYRIGAIPFFETDKNGIPLTSVVCSVPILFPQMCYLMMALSMLIERRIYKLAGASAFACKDMNVIWDEPILITRRFQAAFFACMERQLSSASYTRFRNYITHGSRNIGSMYVQYLELRNIAFINSTPQKRKSQLTIEAKRLSEFSHDAEYHALKGEIDAYAAEHGISAEDVGFPTLEYPDPIPW
jgi:hypothetical protein